MNINKINYSLLYNLCGDFNIKELTKIMIIIKLINDYNILNPLTKIYNFDNIDELIDLTCENLSRCTNPKTTKKYSRKRFM